MGNKNSNHVKNVVNDDDPTLFNAKVISDYQKANKCGISLVVLEVAKGELVVHSRDMLRKITAWPIKQMQKYQLSTDEKHLVIRAGPQCDTGVGTYLFFCNRAREIYGRLRESWRFYLSEENKLTFEAQRLQHMIIAQSQTLRFNSLPRNRNQQNHQQNIQQLNRQPITPSSIQSSYPSTPNNLFTPANHHIPKLASLSNSNHHQLTTFTSHSENNLATTNIHSPATTATTLYSASSATTVTTQHDYYNTPGSAHPYTPHLPAVKETSGDNKKFKDSFVPSLVKLQPPPKNRKEVLEQRRLKESAAVETTSFSKGNCVKIPTPPDDWMESRQPLLQQQSESSSSRPILKSLSNHHDYVNTRTRTPKVSTTNPNTSQFPEHSTEVNHTSRHFRFDFVSRNDPPITASAGPASGSLQAISPDCDYATIDAGRTEAVAASRKRDVMLLTR